MGSERAPRRGVRGFIFWFGYYYELARTAPNPASSLWSLTQLISNRLTYRDFAPGDEER